MDGRGIESRRRRIFSYACGFYWVRGVWCVESSGTVDDATLLIMLFMIIVAEVAIGRNMVVLFGTVLTLYCVLIVWRLSDLRRGQGQVRSAGARHSWAASPVDWRGSPLLYRATPFHERSCYLLLVLYI